jgi:hypothetical protein
LDPLHDLALIEQKINALEQAAPLANWQLPEEFATLRRLLEARMGRKGKREFVQVLRLMETFRIEDVSAAVRDGIGRGAVGFDAIKHLLAMPDRAAAPAPRSVDLSLSAARDGEDHVGARLQGAAS